MDATLVQLFQEIIDLNLKVAELRAALAKTPEEKKDAKE